MLKKNKSHREKMITCVNVYWPYISEPEENRVKIHLIKIPFKIISIHLSCITFSTNQTEKGAHFKKNVVDLI